MRVVLDPNVIVSALLSPSGAPAQLPQAWREDRFELLVSPHLVEEVADVLRRPKIAQRLDRSAVDDFIDALPLAAMLRSDPAVRPGATRDPDDDYLVALALAHGADFLVSGDRHVLDGNGDIPRLTPRQALDRLGEP